ncbi:trichohyalin-like isoform X4 [Bombus pyrosoma]|nr:trichohyalin-like isoform X4 [Bombus pyrosoma]XP_043586621.1 trichohyalin-like isoform X4 [Bombus pyrosoma]
MQPGVTVVLATVWLAVYVNVVGTVSHYPSRLTLDQYTPLPPQYQQHEVYRRVEGQPDWKDQNPGENQSFDLSIGPRRLISANTTNGSQRQSHGTEYLKNDLLLRRPKNRAGDHFSPLVEDKQPRNFAGQEFTDEKVDSRDSKDFESTPRELSPPSELEDPFVADDTFQDQGPGSVEIYKLDVFRVKPLLSPTPVTRFPSKGKSKTPKKTSYENWKSKTPEYKATSLNILHKQSNSFDDFSTEIPANTDPFSIGGVPELQVGCEGLEAPDHSREKRSIDSPGKDKNPKEVDPWADVTPISLNLDYELSGEEDYEEMDELLKLKKLETTTKRIKHSRGDMDATIHSDFHKDKGRTEKLPVRGDLGKSSVSNESTILSDDQKNRKTEEKKVTAEVSHFNKGKRDDYRVTRSVVDETLRDNHRRKILWFEDSDVEQLDNKNGKRTKRLWGFGEDEGVATSDELQTVNQRRKLNYAERKREEEKRKQEEERRRREEEWRRRQEAQRRNYIKNQTNSDIENIRNGYEKMLEQREREEKERRWRLQQSNRWHLEEEQRRRLQEEESRRNRLEEQRRMQELETRRRYDESPTQTPTYDGERERERQQAEEIRRREENRLREEERQRRLQKEELRRREQNRWVEEMKRRQQEQDRRSLEERRREWMLKRKQEEEEQRKRHQQDRNEPSNLLYSPRNSPNANKLYDPETERRMREQQEKEHQQKLDGYIQRNRPINLNKSIDRQREEANRWKQEEERRRLEEERKLQDYIRRNQPVRVPEENESSDKIWMEYRRKLEEARQYNRPRYPGPETGRRNHGPLAPTNIDPRAYNDARRKATRTIEEEEEERQRQQQEQLRKEALRREAEVRRIQSRKYEEERRRKEATMLEAERNAKVLREAEIRRNQAERTRLSHENRRRFDGHRSRHDTSLIPANLLLDDSRRAMERQRQQKTKEQEERQLEAERRRAKEAREKEERDRVMKEHRRRQEEARLNALPVSASIIVQPVVPNVLSRTGFDIDMRLDPYHEGVKVPNFPAPPTRQPPAQSPSPCVWAVVQCCPSKTNRLVTCFESMGCPGINWDPNPCKVSIIQAAKQQVANFYAQLEEEDFY